jgi:hypothetical protein
MCVPLQIDAPTHAEKDRGKSTKLTRYIDNLLYSLYTAIRRQL